MILTCPNCAARFVLGDRRIDSERPEATHPACGAVWSLAGEAPTPEPVAQPDEPAEPDDFDHGKLRYQLTRATTIRFRAVPALAIGSGFALATLIEIVFLFRQDLTSFFGL